jgi:hypothetical protein
MRQTLIRALWWLGAATLLLGAAAAQAADPEPIQFRNMRKSYDAASQVVWYVPVSAPEVVKGSAFYLYFGRGDRGRISPLRLKTIYYGEQALQVRRYWANADGKQLISLPAGAWHVEDVRHVWEWLDEPIVSARQLHDLLTLAEAKSATIYIRGKRNTRKFTLSKEQKRALRDVISAYQASGGSSSP